MITRPQTNDTANSGASTVRFRVSSEMVARFAALTGDRSSLHVNEAFARRSAYRQPVVHGMLPVAFLALDPRLRANGLQAVPVVLAARFTAPVFQGESLTLTVDAGRPVGDGDRRVRLSDCPR